ncbi:hypothetical protein ADEAN_000290600 [Angomonas deanei]|uniref:Uncharacterized protein n=1 Tax=Angomonas deanei TaxID=59799 RepID=A0A7G2C8T7_9TRYP|nr:hypothetical protein ADEAN_000290600 [Angomonas deanei]
MEVGSNTPQSSKYSHSRVPSEVLSETLSRNPTINKWPSLQGLDFANDADGHTSSISFSSLSLMVVWLFTLVGGVLCFALCEVYQEFYPDFPLPLLIGIGCQIHLLCALLVYPLGVKKYGRYNYRFYQPFQGGLKFVMLQLVGVFCVVSSIIGLSIYCAIFDKNNITKGIITILSVSSCMGCVLILQSLQHFIPAKASVPGSPRMGGAAAPFLHDQDARPQPQP